MAGATTWLTMSYIIVVNPGILAAAGIDHGAAFVATCVAAAIGSAAMGLFANLPLALAPGMGLNAYFAFSVVKGMGVPWQVALGAVFLSGVGFLLISIFRIREWLINAIPLGLKLGIGAGIGLFLGLIGLHDMGVVTGNPETLVTLGNLRSTAPLLSCIGFLLIAGLAARRVPGAILIGILVDRRARPAVRTDAVSRHRSRAAFAGADLPQARYCRRRVARHSRGGAYLLPCRCAR